LVELAVVVKPEDKARLKIDELLKAAGWRVQDYQGLNLLSNKRK